MAENYAKRRLARRKEREEQADSQEKDSVLFPMAVILTANEGGSEVDNRISDEKKGLKRGEARCSENREGLRVNSNAAGSSSNGEDDELVIGQIQSRKYGRSDIQVKESEDKEAVPVSETETELDEEETEVKMELFNNNF